MTVIVWDGATLATDGATTDGHVMWPTEKAWYWQGFGSNSRTILSGAGPLPAILIMKRWYIAGANQYTFPAVQRDPQTRCDFIVVNSSGLHRYEHLPEPVHHEHNACAFGEGRDFAYGAMAMGADAEQAARIACRFSPHCGLDIHTYRLDALNSVQSEKINTTGETE